MQVQFACSEALINKYLKYVTNTKYKYGTLSVRALHILMTDEEIYP